MKTKKELTDEFNNLFTKREVKIMNLRSEKQTLASIGLELYLTKERIRQILIEIDTKIKDFFDREQDSIYKYFVCLTMYDKKLLKRCLHPYVPICLVTHSRAFRYNNKYCLFLNQYSLEAFSTAINRVIKNAVGKDAVEYIKSSYAALRVDYPCLKRQELFDILKDGHLVVEKEFFRNKKIGYRQAISKVQEDFFKKGISIKNEEKLLSFADTLLACYSMEVRPELLTAYIKRDLFLAGPSVYKTKKSLGIESETLNELCKYVKKSPKKCSYKDLWENIKYNSRISKYISGKENLHGVLKAYREELNISTKKSSFLQLIDATIRKEDTKGD